MEPKWYDGWNLDKLSKYVVVKPQVNQTEAHFMSHDNITDTYTYIPESCGAFDLAMTIRLCFL